MILIYILIAVLTLIVIWDKLTRKYINPYKLYFFMGKKGSGKSTVLTKIALQELKKGKSVFSTEDVPGTYEFKAEYVGFYELPENSVVLIDEASIAWNNRHWKSLRDEVIEWYRFQRKRKLTVYLFSQTFDVDVKIRDLSDEMFLVTKFARVLSIARRIDKSITIKNGSAEAPSTLAEDYKFVPLFSPNSIKITFIPKYTKYFTSFNPPPLPVKDFILRPPIEDDRLFPIIFQSFKEYLKGELPSYDDDEDDTIVYELPEPSPALLQFLNEEEEL